MTYHHLVTKLIKLQDKIMPSLKALENDGQLPQALSDATIAVSEWSKDADMKLSTNTVESLAPNPNPVMEFSSALRLYQNMFDSKVKNAIEEYTEYAEALLNMTKE